MIIHRIAEAMRMALGTETLPEAVADELRTVLREVYEHHSIGVSCKCPQCVPPNSRAEVIAAKMHDGTPVPPQMLDVARQKLDGLLAEGWELDGFGIRRPSGDTMRHGLVTTGGRVLWWHGPTQESAQELLECLKTLVDADAAQELEDAMFTKARSAIAKATGQQGGAA